MSESTEQHPDPNPVRPSQAEGDPSEQASQPVEPDTSSSDPHTERPSQAEGGPED